MDNKDERKLVVTEQYAIEYGGPLPPAAEYERYERAFPGTAESMLKMAEVEAEHRRKLENKELDVVIRGQTFAFIIGLTALGAAALCAFLNQAVVAIVPAILGCVSLASAFLVKKK